MTLSWLLIYLLVVLLIVIIFGWACRGMLIELKQLQLKVNQQRAELSIIKSNTRSLIRSLDNTTDSDLTASNIENHKRRLSKLVK